MARGSGTRRGSWLLAALLCGSCGREEAAPFVPFSSPSESRATPVPDAVPIADVPPTPPTPPPPTLTTRPALPMDAAYSITEASDRFTGRISWFSESVGTGVRGIQVVVLAGLFRDLDERWTPSAWLSLQRRGEELRYSDHHQVDMLLDGVRFTSFEASYDWKWEFDGFTESFSILAPAVDIEHLLRATRIELRVGIDEVDLSERLLQTLRAAHERARLKAAELQAAASRAAPDGPR